MKKLTSSLLLLSILCMSCEMADKKAEKRKMEEQKEDTGTAIDMEQSENPEPT